MGDNDNFLMIFWGSITLPKVILAVYELNMKKIVVTHILQIGYQEMETHHIYSSAANY